MPGDATTETTPFLSLGALTAGVERLQGAQAVRASRSAPVITISINRDRNIISELGSLKGRVEAGDYGYDNEALISAIERIVADLQNSSSTLNRELNFRRQRIREAALSSPGAFASEQVAALGKEAMFKAYFPGSGRVSGVNMPDPFINKLAELLAYHPFTNGFSYRSA